MSSDFWNQAHHLCQLGQSFVTVTLIATRGHAPQDVGAKVIITAEGLAWGTIGGGKVEAKAILLAQELLRTPEDSANGPKLITWNLQRDVGMTCGGEVTYLFEAHVEPGWKIVLFGAGHVAQAVVRTLGSLQCQVTCVDWRPEWLERLPRLERLKTLLAEDSIKIIDLVESFDPLSYFVLMTQGHATDLPILERILKVFPQAPYTGVIGSGVKALKIRNELKSKGLSQDLIERLYCPIGLPLGSNDPAEIAISVVAQLLQVRDRNQSNSPIKRTNPALTRSP